jgi:hypothetical protein
VKLARLLLIAVLAIVVPFQGAAAVGAGQCMALGHHDSAGNHGHDSHNYDSHAGSTNSADDHGAATATHCGPCTACCASAAIAGPARLSILSSLSETQYFFSQLPPLGVQPDGVDRPPLAL